MTNEEMTLEALKLCRKTKIFIPANEYLDTAINSIQENTKLKAEIERLNTQIAESNQEGVSILHDILELREENKYLEEQVVTLSRSLADCYRRDFDNFVEYRDRCEKLDKYNSELCVELTITIDKLCLAEKEIERLRNGK